jgi:hypothetical protein
LHYVTPQIIEHRKDNAIDADGNPKFGLGQAQKCNWVKPVNWILTHPALDNVLFIVLFIFRGIKQTGVSFTGWIPFT